MKEFLTTINNWREENTRFSIARVTQTWGASPRPIGSTMLISKNGEMVGSVSGGCVEGDVLKEASALHAGLRSKILKYGISNENAWEVGLSCGGKLEVFLQAFNDSKDGSSISSLWDQLEKSIRSNKNCALITRLEDNIECNTLIFPDGSQEGHVLSPDIIQSAMVVFEERRSALILANQESYFAHIIAKRSQLIIIGSAHLTAELIQLAKMHDFEVIVIDPRGAFAQKTEFIVQPDTILEKYPSEVLNDYALDSYTYAVVLSHDPKIDDDALKILLPSKVAYIGALGSRKTHASRIERLKEYGFSEQVIDKIEAPVGVDIKAKTPKEIALSIMGGIIRAKNQFY